MRTLLLGLDGVCRPVLDPLCRDGITPTVADLLERGTNAALTSQLPPWTPSAWPSLYTGVNPGKHGVYGFLTFEGYEWDVVNASHVREHALWELLDYHGVSSVVVNVPVTAPAATIDGAIVPGYVAPESPPGYPGGIVSELDEELGGYSVYGPLDTPGEVDLASVAEHARTRGDAFRLLVDRYDPEFGFLEFQQTDTVFHNRPTDREAVETVFGAVDDTIADVIDDCDPDDVVIVSDHGIGPYDGEEIRVNECLRECGFVTGTVDGEGMPSWDAIARQRLQNDDPTATSGTLERATASAAKLGLTSQRINGVLEPLGLAEVVADLVPTDAIRAGTEQVDFPASRAYMRSRIELGVRINLAGREPDGVVAPENYETVRTELIDALSGLDTPAGEPAFDRVAPREAVFSGPYVEAAPDVVVVPAGFDHFLNGSLLGDRFGSPREPWNHKREGIVAAAGDGVDGTAALDAPHLFDVAPTVLSLLGIPRSDRMDGEVLPIVDPAPVETYPAYDGDRVTTVDEAVERRLAQLGYLGGGDGQ